MARYAIDPVTLVRLAEEDFELPVDLFLVAPNVLRIEALEILLTRVHDGRIGERDALRLHERMTGYKIRLLGDRVSRRTAWDLATSHGWEDLRDAEYIAIAQLQADALIAGDLHLAARAAGLVAQVDFDDLHAT